MTGAPPSLSDLPPLWATDGRETAELVLPLRLACRWHRLTWYPVERSGDVLYGLTLETVPRWRHFDLSELMARHGGHPALLDPAHRPAAATAVPELADALLLDLSPFHPTKPRLP
ncbi:MAG TPA: hypothetical protein VK196_01760 [Magnetospirillum sp.]|nr:hypothetical protein [Magnetospirillum sp.]